ncbi:Haloalkane dehalogenase [Seminavis robusta]|uniref:Haloalkane dehalogenase n=1 Tax=Seminavis robusta TaxID=568900 RepID=A0A9N8H6I7_9STRA|nr:Haloalkane dehalogenase [Seminavis robusta]|eukprot:Sro45_g026860.1 Haloalkane dehalogenase (327) ;mRNA; r:28058-29038
MKIEALRTPESCFDGITDFPYPPQYVDDVLGTGLRLCYYDIPALTEDENGPVFLCLHGEPTWSYLYRHMIPVFQTAGRVLCVDMMGFGRSDKPIRQEDYSYSLHRAMLLSIIEQHLNLTNVTLVVQDWGGILGLTLPLEAPQRYSRLVLMNAMLPIEPESTMMARDLLLQQDQRTTGFGAWHAFSQSSDDWNVGDLIHLTCRKQLSPETVAAYNAPYPSAAYKAGVNVFTKLVPFSPTQDGYAMGRAALQFWQHQWAGPTFLAVGARDRVIPPALMNRLASCVRGCGPPLSLPQVGHFVQEQAGAEVARAALQYFAKAKPHLLPKL